MEKERVRQKREKNAKEIGTTNQVRSVTHAIIEEMTTMMTAGGRREVSAIVIAPLTATKTTTAAVNVTMVTTLDGPRWFTGERAGHINFTLI